MQDDIIDVPNEASQSPPEWWVKVVEFLQQNWALPIRLADGYALLFADDRARVFDRLQYSDEGRMLDALRRNGFEEFAETPRLKAFLRAPELPLSIGRHPNGRIYSSGRFWQE